MRKIFHTLMLVMAMAVMAAPATYAQRNHGAHGNDNRTERRKESARPAGNRNHSTDRGHSGRPGAGTSNRPSNRPSTGRPDNSRPNVGNGNTRPKPGTGTSGRPGLGSGTHQRPETGNKPAHGNKPSHGNRPGVGNAPAPGHRPGVGNRPVVNNRPGADNRPGVGHHPGNNHRPSVGHRPGHSPSPRPPMIAPPHRPYRPVIARPHYRPVPPPAWRPRRGIPLVRGILGLTFGAAFNVSLDYLYNSGYTVDGYANNIVYLRNVPAMNYIWTDGALYYGNNGLDASSFYYSTPTYDLSRYNAVYSNLVNTYGVPVTVNNTGGVMSSTWFGGNNGYVTLSFGAGTAGRFLTTLTLGL